LFWAVLLGILKWIGIVFGSIIALFLLLCLFLLFSRLKYDVRVDKAAQLRVRVKVRWLLSLVRIDFAMIDEKQRLRIRVFGLLLGPKKEKQVESADEPSRAMAEEGKALASEAGEAIENDVKDVVAEAAEQAVNKAEPPAQEAKPKKAKRAKKEKGESLFTRLKRQYQTFRDFPDKKLIWQYTKRLLIRLLRALRPEKFEVRGVIGFDDPSVTGKALAAIAVISRMTGLRVNLRGNFEEQEITVHGILIGRVRIWSLAWPILVYVFKKPIWKLVKPALFQKKKRKESME